MKNYSAKVNGKNIIYQDTVVIVTTTSFTFWQRIMILFGCKLCMQTQVFTREKVTPIEQTTQTTIVRLPKKKIQNDQPRKN